VAPAETAIISPAEMIDQPHLIALSFRTRHNAIF